MNRLDGLVTGYPLPTWRGVAWVVMLLLGGLVVWAQFAVLDEVAVATGEVAPQGKVKVIQHLEGGIIEEIHVKEGDTVKVGAPLVNLNLATSGVNKKELLSRLDGLFLLKGRLVAEAHGTDIVFPEGVAKRRPAQAEAEKESFEARKRELVLTLNVMRSQVKQRDLEVAELEARRRATAHNLRLARERFKMSKSLLKDGLTAKMDHLELEAEVESLQGEIASLKPAIPRARAAVAEAAERIKERESNFHREAQEELGITEKSITRVEELLEEATEQGDRAEIKSPIKGVVKNMRYHTIGGVVRPGEAILEIVPTGGVLVIDAKLNPTDRGYVKMGQRAVVKISTYDFVRYGGLEGEVILLAPDASTSENGIPFFRVVVQTKKTYLGEKIGILPIIPGMQATVDIHTGVKSVADYLIKPVLKLKHESFRER
jgi:membrane fusion protein, adhesin transport system